MTSNGDIFSLQICDFNYRIIHGGIGSPDTSSKVQIRFALFDELEHDIATKRG